MHSQIYEYELDRAQCQQISSNSLPGTSHSQCCVFQGSRYCLRFSLGARNGTCCSLRFSSYLIIIDERVIVAPDHTQWHTHTHTHVGVPWMRDRPVVSTLFCNISRLPGRSGEYLDEEEEALTHWGRVTQICVFNTRLFSLHNTLNYAVHRACLRMVLLTDVYRKLTSLWINL